MSAPATKKPRVLDCSLRGSLLKEEIINGIKAAWISPSNKEFKNDDVEIITYPFPVCVVHNFISSPELLKSAVDELKGVKFHEKNNDLYQFQQSDDVRNLTNYTYIPQLYDLIRTDGLSWVQKVVNVRLKGDISATFSKYKYKDRLLCHDDKCEDRHIAFILYLVENWKDEDGGSLQLFNTDSNFYSNEVVKSINPKFNSLIFFEVTHQSFHQVDEVLSQSKERVSLNGWFHSVEKKFNQSNCKVLENKHNVCNDKDFNFENYVLHTYLDQMNKLDIKSMFLIESEIQLEEFFVQKFWDELKSDVRSDTVKWSLKKPANIRKYETADLTSLSPSLQTLKDIFESKCWFKYLKSITGLDFVPSETSDIEIWNKGQMPNCFFELQRWTPSCYTLIHDQDPEFHSEALDVILRIPLEGDEFKVPENNDDVPETGHIIYIDADSKDEECLLHIGYKINSLALIFRDKKTLRFTKYLDSTASGFYQIFCTYRPWTPPVDQPDLKHCEESSESEGSELPSENPSEDESSGD